MKRILRFTADWCNPCKQLSENMERANLKIPVEVIDVEKNESVANHYGIRNLPTMILLDENIEIKRISGLKTANQIKTWINE
jgi:thioredoxin-like negative regulator of GroEL